MTAPLYAEHHKLAGAASLQKAVKAVHGSGGVPDDIWDAHERYHHALLYKLECAAYHYSQLQSILSSTSPSEALDSPFGFQVNLCLDGFLHAGGSVLDILAREVLSYFDLTPSGNIYYHTARGQLAASRPGDGLLPLLSDPAWLEGFKAYRNSATHEQVIAASRQINITERGNTQQTTIVVPLPDDPNASSSARTYRKNPDALAYTNTHLKRVLSHVNQVYSHLAPRIEAAGTLPL